MFEHLYMTRTLHYSLAAAFIAAFCFNSGKADHFAEGQGGPPVIHLPNPFPGSGPFSEDPRGEANSHGGGNRSNGISYHGGPIMLGQVNAYAIWYGTWADSS